MRRDIRDLLRRGPAYAAEAGIERSVKIRATGALAQEENVALVRKIHDAAQDQVADRSLCQQGVDLWHELEESDDDRGVVAFGLAQLHWLMYLKNRQLSDAGVALALIREASRSDHLPEFAVHHERGRIAYEMGRELASSTLLDEASTYYGLAMIQATSGPEARRLRSQRRDAVEKRQALIARTMREARGQNGSIGHLEFPVESCPVENDCWTSSRPRPRSFLATTFLVDLFEYPVAVDLRRTPRRDTRFRMPSGGRTARGRAITSLSGYRNIDPNQVDQLSLAIALPLAAGDAEDYLAAKAREIYEWGERVNRWLDLLTQKPPFAGSWASRRRLFGHVQARRGSRDIALIADELGVTHELTVPAITRMTRFHVASVLNELAAHPVPVAIELLRSAQHSLLMHEPREAVVAAGTAAESALGVAFDSRSPTRPRDRRWTLGTLAAEVSRLPRGLPPGETQATVEAILVKPRNDAVHRAVVTHHTAAQAVGLCMRIVDDVFDFQDGDPTRVANRMEKLGGFLDSYQAPTGGFPQYP